MVINSVKAVIFDLDDALYDRNAVQIEFAKHLFRYLPHVFVDHEIEAIISAYLETDRIAEEDYGAGSPWTRDKYSRYFLRSLGIDEHHTDSVTELYNHDRHKIHLPVPGAVATVKEISKRFQTALITGGFSDVQNAKLKAIGLLNSFDYTVFGEEFGILKPDPEIFRHTASLLSISPSECLYIGDSYKLDVIGPKNAGMLACWYNPKKVPPPELNDVRADFVIESLPEILRILCAD
jgi:HAD superfamily hydrolase (TIGR01509 family)